MVLQKRVLLLLLCAGSASLIEAHGKHGLRATVGRLTAQTLATGAQTVDYLLYPLVCWAAGRVVYQNYLAHRLPDAPGIVTSVEGYLPGKDAARVGATHIAVGAALFVALKAFMKVEAVNAFVQTNMPHLAQVIAQVATEESAQDVDADEDTQPKVHGQYPTCR